MVGFSICLLAREEIQRKMGIEKLKELLVPTILAGILSAPVVGGAVLNRIDAKELEKAVAISYVRNGVGIIFYHGFDDDNDGNIDRIRETSFMYWHRTAVKRINEATPDHPAWTRYHSHFDK